MLHCGLKRILCNLPGAVHMVNELDRLSGAIPKIRSLLRHHDIVAIWMMTRRPARATRGGTRNWRVLPLLNLRLPIYCRKTYAMALRQQRIKCICKMRQSNTNTAIKGEAEISRSSAYQLPIERSRRKIFRGQCTLDYDLYQQVENDRTLDLRNSVHILGKSENRRICVYNYNVDG